MANVGYQWCISSISTAVVHIFNSAKEGDVYMYCKAPFLNRQHGGGTYMGTILHLLVPFLGVNNFNFCKTKTENYHLKHLRLTCKGAWRQNLWRSIPHMRSFSHLASNIFSPNTKRLAFRMWRRGSQRWWWCEAKFKAGDSSQLRIYSHL